MLCLSKILRLSLLFCASLPAVSRADEMIRADRMLVISGHPDATKLGIDVMKKGGNAIDALVTVSLALGVGEPGNSGLGGKIVCLYYDAKLKKTTSVIAMDACPLHLPVADLLSLPSDQRQRGWVTICTPGLAAALGEAHAKWGIRPWEDDVQPVVKLATDGVVLSQRMAEMMSQYQPQIDPAARSIYAPSGKVLAAGETLRNPDLAHTMQAMADHGYRDFYEGETATRLVKAAKAGGGYLAADDLKRYHARFVEPLEGDYRGYTIDSSPPPLSGGATLLAALDCLGHASMSTMHSRDAREIDLIGRVMEQVYPEIATSAADFSDSPQQVYKVLSPGNIAAMYDRAIQSDPREPTTKKTAAIADPLKQTRADGPTWDDSQQASTTHLIIVDQMGDIVCCTQSLGIHFGAAVVAPGTGFLLNADVNNFSLATPSSKNFITPGRWPRSTMTPTIVFKDHKPILAIGSPAGQRIPTAVLQVMVDVLDFHRPLEEAIRAPRFHIRHATSKADHPNDIDIEQQADASLDQSLSAMGWSLHRRDDNDFYFGSVNAAEIQPDGHVVGVADQRRTSDAGGV